MAVQPTKLSLPQWDLLVIQWSDGMVRQYRVADLRQNCPCAACRTEQQASGEDRPAPLPGKLTVQKMRPVGSYAYNIHFSDGHQTGIYPLELLRRLGETISQKAGE